APTCAATNRGTQIDPNRVVSAGSQEIGTAARVGGYVHRSQPGRSLATADPLSLVHYLGMHQPRLRRFRSDVVVVGAAVVVVGAACGNRVAKSESSGRCPRRSSRPPTPITRSSC